jgi:glycosyltransferase involved in cell wall biosynthesis
MDAKDIPPNLRVAFVLPAYLPESYGGGEQQARKLADAFDKLGVGVTILAPRLKASTKARERSGAVLIRRFRVASPPNLGGRHFASLLSWSLQLSWWLYRNRRQYDVIQIVHARLHCLPAVLTGAMLNKPTLIKLGRGGEQFDFETVKQKKVYGPFFSRLIMRYTTAFIANSAVIETDLRQAGIEERRIYRIPNGVELPNIAPNARTGVARFLYFGRLDREKGIERMIRGFAEVARSISARLTLVGDGSCRRELETLVQKLGAESQVRFLPPTQDIAALLRDADFYVSTSLSEGMSNALLESMAHGVPAIVSRVSGVDEIVSDGKSGYVFEPGDDEAFAQALRRGAALSPDAWRAMALEAMVTVGEKFGIDAIARRFIETYRSVL